MKFTLSWLKDHLETQASLETIVETLTAVGLEVETVDDPGKRLKGFTIAQVVSAQPHPNADRLRVCVVDTGVGTQVQVVCGAPNARSGMKAVFSPPGTYIPGKDLILTKGVIRGVESNGMLCSGKELQISDDHDGIIEVPADAPIGAPYAEWASLADPVIEINLTPNRPDAAGIAGIARDLAAAGLGTLKVHKPVPVAGQGPCPVSVKLDLAPQDEHLCPAFALRLVRGVSNGASPDWMQRRLRAIGLRPINALVDITNYITFDRGRPLHVFDAKKVAGNLVVRRAAAGESVLALDGRRYELDAATVVIADDHGVESIAGIMGGEHSGCDAATTDVLIESALWDPLNVALSGRRLGIRSDARYRFERGVDPAFCVPGAELAARLVLDICGGTPTELIVVRTPLAPDRTIDFPIVEVERLTGLDMPVADMEGILGRLGFGVEASDTSLRVRIPSWRPDIDGKADIVEEIVRISGLHKVAAVPLPRAGGVALPVLTLLQWRTRAAKRALAARGLVEAVTWSFISKSHARAFGGGGASLAVANPIAADLSDMRPSLLPGLMSAAQRNADRGFGEAALFEVGQVFLGSDETAQRIAASAVRRGSATPSGAGRHWSRTAAPVSALDAKADAMALLSALGVSPGSIQIVAGGAAWLHPGRSGTLQFGPRNVVGHFGEFHPRLLEELDMSGPLCGFELILDSIPAPKSKGSRARGKLVLSELMPVERDFAFVVDIGVGAAEIVRAAQAAERSLVADASIFDVYVGPGIGPGQKSVGLAVSLQPRDKTLTDAEIDAVGSKIVSEVAKRTGGYLRQ